MNRAYFDSVQLLLDAAPAVFSGGLFALKGGTAINLFIRGLPRLSVDLDLVYTDQRSPREQALVAISGELKEARKRIEAVGIDSRFGGSEAEESKLLLQRSGVRVKIEVNHIFRATLLDTVERPLVQEAQDLFFSGHLKHTGYLWHSTARVPPKGDRVTPGGTTAVSSAEA